MTTTQSTPVDALAPHIDHELSQLIRLHHAMRKFWYRWLPEPVRRACRVAYAAHFRAVMEFVHDGRPSHGRRKSVGCEDPRDIIWGSVGGAPTPFPNWTDDEIRRLCDADKLVGHLSQDRITREASTSEWGSDHDRALWRPYVAMFVGSFDAVRLPKTARAWRQYEMS